MPELREHHSYLLFEKLHCVCTPWMYLIIMGKEAYIRLEDHLTIIGNRIWLVQNDNNCHVIEILISKSDFFEKRAHRGNHNNEIDGKKKYTLIWKNTPFYKSHFTGDIAIKTCLKYDDNQLLLDVLSIT